LVKLEAQDQADLLERTVADLSALLAARADMAPVPEGR
jgi:hypothetical protein